jgi:hypothetical protein
MDRLRKLHARGAQLFDRDMNIQFIVKTGRRNKTNMHVTHHEADSGVVAQPLLIDSASPKPFAARALQKTQVSGVIDHASRIGIFPVHPYRPAE